MARERRQALIVAAALLISALLGVIAHWLFSGGVALLPVAPELTDAVAALPAPPPENSPAPVEQEAVADLPASTPQASQDAAQSVEPAATPEVNERVATTISGRVVDEFGRGVAGARLHRVLGFHGTVSVGQRIQPPSLDGVTVDESGNFSFEIKDENVEGSVVLAGLVAEAEGFLRSDEHYLRGLTIGEQRTGVVLVVFQPGTAKGRVVDGEGKPVAGAMVTPIQQGDATAGSSLPRYAPAATTDEEGVYRLNDLKQGVCGIQVGESGGVRGGRPFPESAHGIYRNLNLFHAVAGTEVVVPDIVLGPPTTAVVRLLLPDGSPLPSDRQVWVTVWFAQGNMGLRWTGQPDEEGRIEVHALHPDNNRSIHSIEVHGFEKESPIELQLMQGQRNHLGDIRLKPKAD